VDYQLGLQLQCVSFTFSSGHKSPANPYHIISLAGKVNTVSISPDLKFSEIKISAHLRQYSTDNLTLCGIEFLERNGKNVTI